MTRATMAAPRRQAASGTVRTFDTRTFRNALGRFATGVIVLTVGPRRTPHAMTANAFMSGSLEPPLVVISVGQTARMHMRLAGARRVGVSVLTHAQESVSRHFAGQTVRGFAPTFQELRGVPVVAHAAVMIAARIEHRYRCGDHTLIVGEVEDLVLNAAAPPLVFYEGRYRMLRGAHGGPEPWYPSFF
jgi:flavin reductase